jgi:hypothetical protein
MDSTSKTKPAKAIEVSNIGRASPTKAPPAIFTWVIIHSISFSLHQLRRPKWQCITSNGKNIRAAFDYGTVREIAGANGCERGNRSVA